MDAELAAAREAAFTHGSTGPLGPRLRALLDALEEPAERLGAADHLRVAQALAARGGGAHSQRAAFAEGGARGAAAMLARRFLAD